MFAVRLVSGIAASLALIVPALASGPRMERGLDRLEPTTRMMQVCDIKAAQELRRSAQFSKVDRVIVDAMENPDIEGGTVEGKGGAFRENGRWYRMEFKCTLTPDQKSALSFEYTAGDEIPEARWEEYGLWN